MRPQPRSSAAPLSGGSASPALLAKPHSTQRPQSQFENSLSLRPLISSDDVREEKGFFNFESLLFVFVFACFRFIVYVVLAFWQAKCKRGRDTNAKKGFSFFCWHKKGLKDLALFPAGTKCFVPPAD
jgi:hypothetical protein